MILFNIKFSMLFKISNVCVFLYSNIIYSQINWKELQYVRPSPSFGLENIEAQVQEIACSLCFVFEIVFHISFTNYQNMLLS